MTSAFGTPTTAATLGAEPDPAGGNDLLGPWLVRGQRTVILAPTGSGKTTLSMQLVAAALTGGQALGATGAALGPGLLVDGEQSRSSLRRAVAEAGLSASEDLTIVQVPEGLRLDEDETQRAELEALIAGLQPAVVLLDPHYALLSSDSRTATLTLLRFLDRLRREHNFALLLPMHPRKTTSGQKTRPLTIDDVAGAGAATWNSELVLALERLGDGRARLRVLKDRDGRIGTGTILELYFERGQGFTELTAATAAAPVAPVPWLEGPWPALILRAVFATLLVALFVALVIGAP